MGAALELGLLLHTAHYIRDDAVQPDLTPVFDAARQAEDLGFVHVWVGDSSRMERGWPRADCLALLSALAVKTERIKLGVIPLSAPLRDPVLLAHQLATIDVLSGGRLMVSPSIGKGGPEGEREFANCGIAFGERGPRLTEILQIMRSLWTEPSVTFQGRFYSLDDATIFPKPVNRPIPLWVATGRDERALRRVGRYGDGWFTTLSEPEAFAADRQKVIGYAGEAARSPSAVSTSGLYATLHLDRDGDRARAEALDYMRVYFGSHRNTTTELLGSPGEVAQRLQGLLDAGLTTLVIRFLDQDVAKQTELLREALGLLRPGTVSSAAT